MKDAATTIQALKETVKEFITQRNWDQQYPAKNLAINIVVEATELLEKFTWLSCQQAEETTITDKMSIEEELSDILFALLSFCVRYNIDLSQAFYQKIKKNSQKYPLAK